VSFSFNAFGQSTKASPSTRFSSAVGFIEKGIADLAAIVSDFNAEVDDINQKISKLNDERADVQTYQNKAAATLAKLEALIG